MSDCPDSIKNMEINQVLFPALNNDSIYKSMQRGLVYPSAKILLAEIDIENNGTWSDLPNGGKLWRVSIKSPTAGNIGVRFNKFELSDNTFLWAYDELKTQIQGPFKTKPNEITLKGVNNIILEYYIPQSVADNTSKFCKLSVKYIFHYLHKTNTNSLKTLGESLPCQLNVNCHNNNTSAGYWSNVKKGVSLINIINIINQDNFNGTGFLLNNTSNDGKPLYLTAFHNADLNENYLIDTTPKIGRNDDRSCGSNRKYKKCCLISNA